MLLTETTKPHYDDVKLLGAVRVSGASFFVFKNKGRIALKSAREKKLQRVAVQRMIDLNPDIKKILKNYKIKPSINTETLRELSGGHMNETCNVAMGIFEYLPEYLQTKINEENIKEAAMLHDLGKVLIPSKILNKPAKLNPKEREIMNIHSTLGYELLKTQEISEETLDLVKYHHQNLKHSGYPALTDTEVSDLGVQIISTADKYSALRETRVYRRRLSRIESLLILYREVREGKILPDVYKALVKYAEEVDI